MSETKNKESNNKRIWESRVSHASGYVATYKTRAGRLMVGRGGPCNLNLGGATESRDFAIDPVTTEDGLRYRIQILNPEIECATVIEGNSDDVWTKATEMTVARIPRFRRQQTLIEIFDSTDKYKLAVHCAPLDAEPESQLIKKMAIPLAALWLIVGGVMLFSGPKVDPNMAQEVLSPEMQQLVLEVPPEKVASVPVAQSGGGGGGGGANDAQNGGAFSKIFSAAGISRALAGISHIAAGVPSNAGVTTTGSLESGSVKGVLSAIKGIASLGGGGGSLNGGKGVGTQGVGNGNGLGVGGGNGRGQGQGAGFGNGVSFQPGGSMVRGGLERSEVEAVITENISQIRFCYNRGLRSRPNLQGKVTSNFTIGSAGEVKVARIKDSSLGEAEVENCISEKIASWKFPQPRGGGEVVVSYPFLLKAN